MNVDFRNGVISAQTNYLSKSSGSTYTVSIATNVKDLILTASHGASEYLISFYSNITAAWTFSGTDTHYLYVDVDNVTGQLTYGSSLAPITYGVNFPISPIVGETFFNNSTYQSYQWSGDSWVKRIRVFVGFVNNTGVTEYGTGNVTGSSVPYVSGSILYSGNGRGILKHDKTFLTATDRVLINEVPFGASTIEQSALSVKAADTLAANRFVKFNSQGYLTYANPVDVGVSLIFVLTEPLNIGEVTFLPVGGIINNPSWSWSFADLPIWVGENGVISEVDPTLTNPVLPNKQPIGRTISSTSIITNALNFLGSVPPALPPSPFVWYVIDADTQTEPFSGYVVRTSTLTNSIIVTLPQNPIINDEVVVMLGDAMESNYRCTVVANRAIQSLEIEVTIDINNTAIKFVYVGDSVGWAMIVSQSGPIIVGQL